MVCIVLLKIERAEKKEREKKVIIRFFMVITSTESRNMLDADWISNQRNFTFYAVGIIEHKPVFYILQI